jgi:hypothetical protein
MGILPDLAFRLFGHSGGTWFWVPNDQSAHSITERRWSDEPGRHPFVLVADYAGGPGVTVRPRSTTNDRGVEHFAHPADHEQTCKIGRKGWVLRVLWSLQTDAVCAENYSCVEPYEEILEALRNAR